jgi:predicted nucleic acid-binding Zn ribbon protein
MSRSGPRPLASTLRSLRDDVAPETPLAAVQGCWDDAVGPGIAAQARPVAEREGVVTVACAAATWAQELDLLHDDLLRRLAEALGEAAPRRLRFVVSQGRYSDPE